MQHSFLFIRSTVAKVKVLYPLVWRTQVSLYMGPAGALARITQRQPSGGKMRLIMATWRRGESHASSFDCCIIHSHNSEETCNSEVTLDSQIFPWCFVYSSDTARFAVRVCPACCEKGQNIFFFLFSPVVRWLQCSRVMDAAVRALQELDSPAQQLLSKQVCDTHCFPRGFKEKNKQTKNTSTNKQTNK